LLVDDRIPGEDSVLYDREDPSIKAGTIYASMNEFGAAVKQHAINGKFQLGTEKSCKDLFRGYCKAEGCPWSIVARLMRDKQQVRVQTLFHRQHANLIYYLLLFVQHVYFNFSRLLTCLF